MRAMFRMEVDGRFKLFVLLEHPDPKTLSYHVDGLYVYVSELTREAMLKEVHSGTPKP